MGDLPEIVETPESEEVKAPPSLNHVMVVAAMATTTTTTPQKSTNAAECDFEQKQSVEEKDNVQGIAADDGDGDSCPVSSPRTTAVDHDNDELSLPNVEEIKKPSQNSQKRNYRQAHGVAGDEDDESNSALAVEFVETNDDEDEDKIIDAAVASICEAAGSKVCC
jgi:hypothetical protein